MRWKEKLLLTLVLSLFFAGHAGNAAYALDVGKLLSAVLASTSTASVEKARTDFLVLYKAQWRSEGMTEKLNQAIDEAIEEETSGMLWGTKGVQLATNKGNITEKIQEAAAEKFSGAYGSFLGKLASSWNQALKRDVLGFYERNSAQLFDEANHDPANQERLKEQLQRDYDAAAGGRLALSVKKYLIKRWGIFIAEKVSNLVGSLGSSVLEWSPLMDTVRKQLQEMDQSMYADEMPYVSWEEIEPYVQDAFALASEMVRQNVKAE